MFNQPASAKNFDIVIDDRYVCLDATTKFEKKYEIKEHLLSTISNIESGKWDDSSNKRTTWPWTINAKGKGMYFDTKAEAIAKVKELQAKGIKSIDVGCMQINLVFHKDAFESLEDAFDPYKNVEYGAKFLKKLHANTKNDWTKATGNYHSKKPSKSKAYAKKVDSRYEEVKLSLDSNLFEGIGIYPDKNKVTKQSLRERLAKKLNFAFN